MEIKKQCNICLHNIEDKENCFNVDCPVNFHDSNMSNDEELEEMAYQLDNLRSRLSILEEYVKRLEEYIEVLQRINKRPEPFVPHTPFGSDWDKHTKCRVCGIDITSPMWYACNHSNCPSKVFTFGKEEW